MSVEDLSAALESAVTAVRQSARLLRRHRYAPPPTAIKSDGSTGSSLDLESERGMIEVLRSRHPDHAIVAEEGGSVPGSTGWVWYLDPLDGTRAFSAGQDNCCVAATLTLDGEPMLAAVAAPFSTELYTAVRGMPSLVNGRPIQVAPTRAADDRELLLYYDRPDHRLAILFGAAARGELGRLSVLRGSFILSACRTARGAFDMFLCAKRLAGPLAPWDLSPAALVLAGAGGAMLDLEGRTLAGLVPAREVVCGAPDSVQDAITRFGIVLRDAPDEPRWARLNEAVFARLCGRLRSGQGTRIVGIGGTGGGIGKTTFARELARLLGPEVSRVISLDDYLLPRAERDLRNIGAHDPAATDLERARTDLARLRAEEPCEKPVYDHITGRSDGVETVEPVPFVIVEGVMAPHPRLRDLMDLTVCLDAPSSVRVARVKRDVEEKGLSETYARSVFQRFEADVQRHLIPMCKQADVVIGVDEQRSLTWVRG